MLEEKTKIKNPFAGKTKEGNYFEGETSADFIRDNFGEYETAAEMKKVTESEGLKLFFDYLAEEGHIPK